MKRNFNHGKYFVFILCLCLGWSSAKGQQLDFEKYYFGNSGLENYDVIKTSDNGFLMTGNTFGWTNVFFLMKMNEFGDTLWYKNAPYSGPSFSGQTIKELTNGNYAVLCSQIIYQTLLLVIYDSSGNLLSSNYFNLNGNLYITNISESNGNLFLLGQDRYSLGTYLIKTDLFGDSLSYQIDTTFLIANHNNSVCFDGSNFVVAATTNDTSASRYPSIVKFDTSGSVVWKVDYPQYSGFRGEELFRYSDGYIFKTISYSSSGNVIRLDSTGSIIWDTPLSSLNSSVISPDNSRIMFIHDVIEWYWLDSTGAFLQGQQISLTLPNVSSETVVKAFVTNQQIFVTGTLQTWTGSYNSCGFLVQLTDTSIVSIGDFQRNQDCYIYPTVGLPGSNIYFHNAGSASENLKIIMYNSSGKLIENSTMSTGNLNSDSTIKIPDSMTSGLYFFKIITNKANYTFRFIVY